MSGTEWCIYDTWDEDYSPITDVEQEARDAMNFAKALYGDTPNWSDDRFKLMMRTRITTWEEIPHEWN